MFDGTEWAHLDPEWALSICRSYGKGRIWTAYVWAPSVVRSAQDQCGIPHALEFWNWKTRCRGVGEGGNLLSGEIQSLIYSAYQRGQYLFTAQQYC